MNDVDILKFDRPFLLWAYSVSHGQLLFRSVPKDPHGTRIDVLFKDVSAMLVRASYDSLAVRIARSDAERRAVADASGVELGQHVTYYVIEGEPLNFVVAGTVAHAEDQRGYSDPSPLFVEMGL